MPINKVEELLKTICENRQNKLLHLRFADECLNYPKERLIEICHIIKELKSRPNWSCFIRLGNVDENMAKTMAEAGCNFISIGMESGDRRIREKMNKGYSDEELETAIKLFKKYGIMVAVSLIIGYYGETETSVRLTRDSLQKYLPNVARINIWHPNFGEEKTAYAINHSLKVSRDGWSHSTMNEQKANEMATWLNENTNDVAFSPPYTSMFDLWPWFQGEGLKAEEIIAILRLYNQEAKKTKNKPLLAYFLID
jgi:radical SAM superfamily enzyme YgiQ (UPF0313 family)